MVVVEVFKCIMTNNLTREHNGLIVAQKVADARYVHTVLMLSEASNHHDDQIAFSYPFYRIVTCYSGTAEFSVIRDGQPASVHDPHPLCQTRPSCPF